MTETASQAMESTFEQIHVIARRRRWPALTALLAVFVIMASVTLALPEIYRASASVMVDPGQIQDSMVGTELADELETRFFAIGQEVMSRTRLQALIEEFDLYPDIRREGSLLDAVDRMRRDIHIRPQQVERDWGRRNTAAFDISYQSFDPTVVAMVTNRIAALYIEENDRLRERRLTGTAAFLRGQLDEVRSRLEEHEERIRAYRETWLGELPEQQESNLAALTRLNAQLQLNSENQFRLLERRAALLERLEDSGVADAGDGEARLGRLQRQLIEARTRLTDRHPDVVRLRAEIAALETQLAENQGLTVTVPASVGQRNLREVDRSLTDLQREEARLRAEIGDYRDRIERLPQREHEMAQLLRARDALRERHAAIVDRFEAAHLLETLEDHKGQQFRIVDAAVDPQGPAGPDRLRLLAMGLMLAFMAAGAVVVGLEQLDNSLHTVADLKRFTQVPVVGVIPPIVTPGVRIQGWLRNGIAAITVAALLVLLAMLGHRLGSDNMQIVWLLSGRGA